MELIIRYPASWFIGEAKADTFLCCKSVSSGRSRAGGSLATLRDDRMHMLPGEASPYTAKQGIGLRHHLPFILFCNSCFA